MISGKWSKIPDPFAVIKEIKKANIMNRKFPLRREAGLRDSVILTNSSPEGITPFRRVVHEIQMINVRFKHLPLLFVLTIFISCSSNVSKVVPLRIVTELNTGETQNVKLHNGDIVKLSLLELNEDRDSLRGAVRDAYVKISVDGELITIHSGNYNLPVITGKIQIDCPVTKGYLSDTDLDTWKLRKDARFRIWEKNSPYLQPGTFTYPIKQDWFASMTQISNEPTYVDWGENLSSKKIYYHANFDVGGAEAMDEIVSATDGLVVTAHGNSLEQYSDLQSRSEGYKDIVYVIDKRGWLISYVHLNRVDSIIKPGSRIKMGQRIGLIGKESTSGGWVHLHFGVSVRDTLSGRWIVEDPFAYAWEAYVNEYHPPLIALARPHKLAWTGQEVVIDGKKSKSFSGDIVSYEWLFGDGTTANGPVQKRNYALPGEYSEILKVTDNKGNVDYDFAVVQVYDRHNPKLIIPTIQAAYHPTMNLKPGTPVTFLVCTFNSDVNNEEWDFGDNSPLVKVKSQANVKQKSKGKFAEIVHSFAKAGHYIVKVERSNENGLRAVTHLHVEVKN